MADLTITEQERLRVSLASLSGFDPVRLRTTTRCCGNSVRGGDVADFGDFEMPMDEGEECCGNLIDEVDLAHPDTADRVARWLAGRVGIEVGCLAGGWRYAGSMHWVLLGGNGAEATPEVERRDGAAGHGFCAMGWVGALRSTPTVVVALERVDPHDPRRLPDGSRYVDRLALALVAAHVGSQP